MSNSKPLRTAALAMLAAGALALAGTHAAAQDKYPAKPITILVGFSVGGAMDTAARLQGEVMSKMLGVPVVVRNVPGAGGRNSVTILNRSKPDGYTMAAINLPGQAVNQVVRGMDPDLRSFTWIGRQVSNPYFLQATTREGMDQWTSLKQMKTAGKPIKAGITGTGGNTFPISVITANLVGYPVDFIAGFKGPELITGIIRGDIAITNLPWSTAGPPRSSPARPRPSPFTCPSGIPSSPTSPPEWNRGSRSWGRPPWWGRTSTRCRPRPPQGSPRCWRRPW